MDGAAAGNLVKTIGVIGIGMCVRFSRENK